MTHAAAEMAKKSAQTSQESKTSSESTGQNTPLHRRYRQIGISAVAAAARYQGVAKNPAYAPAPSKWRNLGEEAPA